MVVPIDPTGIVEMPDDAGRRSPPEEARAQPLTVYWPGTARGRGSRRNRSPWRSAPGCHWR